MKDARSLHSTNPRPLPQWYESYFIAVLEPDQARALMQIERAVKAIFDRILQLRLGVTELQELEDLNSALTYLGLLSENLYPERLTGTSSNETLSPYLHNFPTA